MDLTAGLDVCSDLEMIEPGTVASRIGSSINLDSITNPRYPLNPVTLHTATMALFFELGVKCICAGPGGAVVIYRCSALTGDKRVSLRRPGRGGPRETSGCNVPGCILSVTLLCRVT